MSYPFFKPTALAVAMSGLFYMPFAAAQTTTLESVVVTGTGNAPTESLTKPFDVLPADALIESGSSTLGDALRNQPGISSSSFGPNASRPIIRGQSADRVKILRNSTGVLDASALSEDHALPVDLFSLSQVEVLRGPAALAYGGNAVGGVVNLVDRRIAREAITGLQGSVQALGGGASQQQAGGFELDVGLGQGLSIHVDGFSRRSKERQTPTFTDPEGRRGDRVRNTQAVSDGAGLGISKQTETGYIGLSTEQFNILYGVPRSLDVLINMDNQRHALEGQQQFKNLGIERLTYRYAETRYQHRELEDGTPATLFINRGNDARVEAELTPFQWAGLSIGNTTGLQLERSDFSAVGDEAFVPPSFTEKTGLFSLFSLRSSPQSAGAWEIGLRADQVDVNAASSGTSPASGPVTGAGVSAGPSIARSFDPFSISLGYSHNTQGAWSYNASLSKVERAPSSFELFADGVHVATSAYEKGNANLDVERGTHAEFSTLWKQSGHQIRATVFQSRFSNYIALVGRQGANAQFNDNGELIQVFDFLAVPARFRGLELGYETTLNVGQGQLKPSVQYDLVRAKRTDDNSNLPRINPQTVRANVEYAVQGWSITPELIWIDDSKAARDDTATPGYTLVNVQLSKAIAWGNTGGEVFLNLNNLTDELAFSATTINTVRNYTPLAGRSALAGVKLLF
jgi:iron complex outermembrane recepter protein